jgi:lipopolysaccharide export system permease protein
VTIVAQEARLESNLDQNTLSIFLTNGLVEVGDRVSMVFTDTIPRVIPLTDASRRGFSTSPTHISMSRLGDVVRTQKQLIHELEETQAAEAAFSLATGDFSSLHVAIWEQKQHQISDARSHLSRLYTEPWRRYASGFSCLCFVCVGAPLAVLRRQSDFMMNFFWCFMPILIGYYPLFSVALTQAKAGAFPSCSVWLSNLACVAVGGYIMHKVLKH